MSQSIQIGCHGRVPDAEWPLASNTDAGSPLATNRVISVASRLLSARGVRAGLLACLAACSAGAAAQDPNIDRSALPYAPALAAIDQLRLSEALADFGEHHADPIALIEAAKMRKMLPVPLNGADGAASDAPWESLLTRAAQLAGPNPMVASLIADVRHLKVRDIPVIPLDIKLLHKLVKQNGADRAEVRFQGGEVAVVYVHPVSGAGLDLFVYDDLNNLICTASSGVEGPECRWRPRRDGSFLIDVRNNSANEVAYELAINRETVNR
jgi:hypothetical protein